MKRLSEKTKLLMVCDMSALYALTTKSSTTTTATLLLKVSSKCYNIAIKS